MLASQTPRIQRLIPAESRKGLPPALKVGLAVLALAVVATGAGLAIKFWKGAPRTANGTPAAPTDPLTAPPPAAAADRVATTPPTGAPTNVPTSAGTLAAKRAPTTLEMGREPATPLIPKPKNTSNPASENPVAPGLPKQPGSGTPGATPQTDSPLPGTGGSTLGSKELTTVSDAQRLIQDAMRAQSTGNLVEARTLLNRALLDERVPANERGAIRAQLAALNDTLIFSPTIAANDPVCGTYTIASGDNLVGIRNKQSLPIDWRLLQRVNKVNPNALRIGQKIKIVRMPFHAVVHKSEYRMDLYVGEPLTPGAATSDSIGPDGQDPSWTFVKSFDVGLGEGNATPEGIFTVKPKSKLVDPNWVNPRTGEKFTSADPKNPIGEHWIGLEGLDDASKKFTSYGIHGTIEPDSIGKQKSMGCVRLRAEEVALVYELLTERMSAVRIMK